MENSTDAQSLIASFQMMESEIRPTESSGRKALRLFSRFILNSLNDVGTSYMFMRAYLTCPQMVSLRNDTFYFICLSSPACLSFLCEIIFSLITCHSKEFILGDAKYRHDKNLYLTIKAELGGINEHIYIESLIQQHQNNSNPKVRGAIKSYRCARIYAYWRQMAEDFRGIAALYLTLGPILPTINGNVGDYFYCKFGASSAIILPIYLIKLLVDLLDTNWHRLEATWQKTPLIIQVLITATNISIVNLLSVAAFSITAFTFVDMLANIVTFSYGPGSLSESTMASAGLVLLLLTSFCYCISNESTSLSCANVNWLAGLKKFAYGFGRGFILLCLTSTILVEIMNEVSNDIPDSLYTAIYNAITDFLIFFGILEMTNTIINYSPPHPNKWGIRYRRIQNQTAQALLDRQRLIELPNQAFDSDNQNQPPDTPSKKCCCFWKEKPVKSITLSESQDENELSDEQSTQVQFL